MCSPTSTSFARTTPCAQGYLIITGVAVAYVFTWIPEWTTWMLLVFMAIYDIVAGVCAGH